MRVLIVEDDDREAQALSRHLERYGEASGTAMVVVRHASALEFMEDGSSYDLIFMDIQMPGINGFEAAAFLRQRDEETPLVFVTTLANQAVQGYEYDALAYLVKPVSWESFARCMRRAERAMRRNAGRRVVLRTKGEVRSLAASDIVLVELEGHDLVYHLSSGERVSIRGSIAAAMGELPEDAFVRASSGTIIGLSHVQGVSGDEVRLSTGEKAYLSRSRKRAALDAIANYLGGSL